MKNLGFIKFQILDNSIIEIEVHPRNVEIPALLAVQQQILTSHIKLFRLKYFEVSWKSEIICSAELAVALACPAGRDPARYRWATRADRRAP